MSEQNNILSTLKDLLRVVDQNGQSALATRIHEEIEKQSVNCFNLVVLGQFKRGKTTFINALLGEEFLPVGVLPLTAVITLVRFGSSKQINVVFTNREPMIISPPELVEYVGEQKNPKNAKKVRYIEISHPAPFLKDGVVLIDTPGIGSTALRNTQTTLEFIPRVDAAIVILSVDPPITQAEYEFLDELSKQVPALFFALNKIDLVGQREFEEITQYTLSVLDEQLTPANILLFPISARQGLEAKLSGSTRSLEQSRLPELESAIRSFLRKEKDGVLLQNSYQRASRLISEARFAVALELKTMLLPLEQLRQNISEFENQIGLITNEREQLQLLLRGEIGALQKSVRENLASFIESEASHLKQFAVSRQREGLMLPYQNFRAHVTKAVSQRLVCDFEKWRKEHESKISDRYQQILRQYQEKVNGYIERVFQVSEQLFHVNMERVQSTESLERKHTFYYRVEDAALFLELDLLPLLALVLPRQFAQKLLLRRVARMIEEKVTMNANSLGYEYVYSIEEGASAFQARLDDTVEQILKEIESILRRAVERSHHHEAAVSQHRAELEQRIERISAFSLKLSGRP